MLTPKSSDLALLDRCHNQHLERNAMHDIKIERRGYDKEGHFDMTR
jgi:hypothetical protein